jgi:membrane-bound serine protease (ClpP class)
VLLYWNSGTTQQPSDDPPKTVLLMQIEGEIERGVSAYVRRALNQAQEQQPARVVIRINTPGGRLDAALVIKDLILDASIPITAFINRQALSAGALISLAADDIVMVEGGVIGAATPITGNSGEKASEKVVSAVRKAFAATAEYHNRDPRIAEAMVDESVEIPGLIENGKLLTLTASEALQWKISDKSVQSLQDYLKTEQLDTARQVIAAPALIEQLVGFLTSSVVSSLLISLGFLGLYFEFINPGWGIGGTLGVIFLALFFWSHFLAGLAGWEGLALVIVGLLLIVVEVLVIPGFGIAGILGLIALAAGLFMSLLGNVSVASADDFLRVGYILVGSFGLTLIGAWALFKYLPGRRSLAGLFLSDRLSREADYPEPDSPQHPHLNAGDQGVAITDLRPAGTARFGDLRVDVVTEGEYVGAGTPIRLLSTHGNRNVVRPVETET